MADRKTLEGTCSCGRNQYQIKSNLELESLQVLFDEKADQGRALSLRLPLSQFQSATYAFYPDETHSAIRRVFTPWNAPHVKRHFCGFCGTQLTVWSEESKEEAEWVCVNLGSLKSESLERLEDAGFLSGRGNQESDVKMEQKDENILTKTEAYQGRELLGTPWFEEMIEGSELGRVRRRRGGQSSSDGRSRVEWEIVEYGNDDEESRIQGSSKRKLDMLARGDDVEMRGG